MSSQEKDPTSAKQQYTSAERSISSSASASSVRSFIQNSPIEARTANVRLLAEGAKRAARFPAPIPDNVLPNGVDLQINLLSKEQWFMGLELSGITWDDTEGLPDASQDVISFYINGQKIKTEYRFDYPVDPASVPATFNIPRDQLGIGERLITFVVENDFSQNEESSDGAVFTVDLTDPNVGNTPIAVTLPNLPSGEVNEAYLTANGGLTVSIPGYFDEQGGDRYVLKYGKVPLSDINGDIGGTPQEVTISAADIRSLGEGVQEISYWLFDRAGNESKLASLAEVRVVLTPQPADLKAPLVPAANPVIDQADARAGADINVPEYTNPLRDDKIDVYASETDGSSPVLLKTIYFPTLTTRLSYAELAARGDEYSVNVYYTVTRGSGQPRVSPSTPVVVDLSTAGPVNPNEPDPVNPLLDKPRVFGAVSDTLDVLEPRDKGQPADVKFNFYDPLNDGEIVRVYYGGLPNPVVEYTVQGGDVADEEKVLSIPWASINQVGNGKIPVFYRIFKNSAATNYQQSETTLVDVSVSTVENMTKPAFVGTAAGATIINCARKPWEGLRVQVRDVNNLKANDDVELHWVMFDNYVINNVPSGAEVPSTKGVFTRKVPAGAAFLDFDIPYYPNMDFTKRVGHCAFFWRIVKAQGAATGTSETVRVNYTLKNGNGYCGPSN
ncbi:hypothetical protein [Pseudomonas aegrilactucae]|uniref:Uncharacterized protein n=1 Tax=Pseudomonas aegrilactucae TaxID=2854028 RepID=A0A9Q2XHL3_9PSED|nr:hypothetical protein [Pseudomonas aegrilactucae]MBV6286289.1 hypothetical protein [Pseudomonas aegrilactucae]